jgi:hypothetical protein
VAVDVVVTTIHVAATSVAAVAVDAQAASVLPVVVLMTAILAHHVTPAVVVTKTTTTVADSANLKAVAMNAKAVLMTVLRAPLRLAVISEHLAATSVAVTMAAALPAATSVPLVVTSVLHAATSAPVSQPLASQWVPSQVMAEKYLCPVTPRSVLHALHVNS